MSCDCCGDAISEFDTQSNSMLRLQEMLLPAGILATMCYRCRQQWVAFCFFDKSYKAYTDANFNFKLWQVRYRRKPSEELALEGRRLFDTIRSIEDTLFEVIETWISKRKKIDNQDSYDRDNYGQDSYNPDY